jgi:hypothetical protein
MTDWDTSQHFKPRDGLVLEEIEDEIVVLDLSNNVYFGLNPVGRRVWKHMEQGDSLGEAIDAIAEHFDVEKERVDADVRAFLADAVENELMTLESGR